VTTLPIGSDFGPYLIVRHIGGGGMAQIYLAKTRGLAGFEKQLALKVINPDLADEERFIEMLIDEAKITVGLTHVNIAQVFDLGQVEGIYYIAMEFVDGIDVLELVNGLHGLGEKVPVVGAAFIGRQICSGLHYAHSRTDKNNSPLNIVHRDISPQNILVSRVGEVKVVDFGIAKAAGMSSKTQAGVIKGKIHYMAPEQAMGEPAERRSDIFSAGIVLWEMLTSRMVYAGDNVKELVERVRKAEIAAPSAYRPEIPPGLDAIVMKALARRATDRYQTAHQFQVALTKFLSSTGKDFGGTQLAKLVERVLAHKRGTLGMSDISVPDVKIAGAKKSERPEGGAAAADGVFEEELASPPPERAQLVVENDGKKSLFILSDEVTIGRAGQLAIADARVSRRHAQIRRDGGSYIVEDLGSSNGTLLNEQPITTPVILQYGDVVRIGATRMLFQTPLEIDQSVTGSTPLVEPRLVITFGEQHVEKVLEEEHALSYEVRIGSARLQGIAGRVKRKENGYWLEPIPGGRVPLLLRGSAVTSPLLLSPGDSFQVGEFVFELVV
jgi:serine/threonine protein kinase